MKLIITTMGDLTPRYLTTNVTVSGIQVDRPITSNVCPSCGADVEPTWRFCVECKEALPRTGRTKWL